MIKVGDRVIVGNPKREELGFRGTVEEIIGTNLCVRFDENHVPSGDNSNVCWYHERELDIERDTTTSPDWHFDGNTLKYHGERDKMYTDMDSEGWSMKDGYAYYTKCCFWEDCKKNPETVLQSCIDLYRAKNKEYQNTDDQFENFTKGAELNMCTREQALWGYCTKQIVSLASIIKTGKNREKISEKARDIIVYMAILEAMQ